MSQVLTERMLTMMEGQDTKDAQFKVKLTLVDSTIRQGTYIDLVVNPRKNPDFEGIRFIKLIADKIEKGLIIYVPITQVATIEWAS